MKKRYQVGGLLVGVLAGYLCLKEEPKAGIALSSATSIQAREARHRDNQTEKKLARQLNVALTVTTTPLEDD